MKILVFAGALFFTMNGAVEAQVTRHHINEPKKLNSNSAKIAKGVFDTFLRCSSHLKEVQSESFKMTSRCIEPLVYASDNQWLMQQMVTFLSQHWSVSQAYRCPSKKEDFIRSFDYGEDVALCIEVKGAYGSETGFVLFKEQSSQPKVFKIKI